MKTIAITMDERLLERLDQVAANIGAKDANRSNLIRTAVSEYLLRLERQTEEEREQAIFKKHRAKIARQAAALVREQAKH